MNKIFVSLALGAASLLSAGLIGTTSRAEDITIDGKAFRKISVAEYRDKMKAGWIGQIAGVCWGAPTEFRWADKTIPEGDMPTWRPEMINDAFGQDDLYVEMTFLKTLEDYGLDVSIRQAGIDFANSEYMLWHANNEGRKNLRRGIAPPNSSHPAFNKCADDIDYQIEADFSGLVSPGLPNNAVRMGETFGRLMNYGDGLYAGQFVGAMYSEAFFETDVEKIIRKEPLDMTIGEVGGILSSSGVSSEKVEAFQKECEKQYGDGAVLNPKNIIESKKYEVTTPEVKITVAPENSYLLETRVINGRKYILIPADEGVAVNGIGVTIPNEASAE